MSFNRNQQVHHNHYISQVHQLKCKKKSFLCRQVGPLIIRYVVASITLIIMQKPHIGHIHWNVKDCQSDGNVSIHLNMEFIMLSKKIHLNLFIDFFSADLKRKLMDFLF